MNFYIGTSGYSYKEWKGKFYPKDLPATQMLQYYGEHFRAVEMNNTFYRMPTAAALKASAAEVPVDFMFAMKAPQQITHFKRLKESADSVSQFIEAAGALKKRMGPLLFGLPPNMKKDAARLRDFLALLPSKIRTTFEFRHQSWFDEEIFSLLRDHGSALCVAEAEDSVEVPVVSTANFGYLRLPLPNYTDANLKTWLKRIQRQKWRDVFIFFKHEDEGNGPRFAQRLLELAKKA